MSPSRPFLPSENIATILLGFLGSLCVGMILTGRAVLDWTSPAFQYLVFGAGTAVLFIVWKRKGFWESTVYALSFALYCAIPMREMFFFTFVNTALFFLFACFRVRAVSAGKDASYGDDCGNRRCAARHERQ